MVATGLIWGQVLHIQPTQTVFVSTCLSLSSTPLVSRFLAGGSRGDKDGTDTSVLITEQECAASKISNVTVLLVLPNTWKGLLSIHFSRKLRLKFEIFWRSLEIFFG